MPSASQVRGARTRGPVPGSAASLAGPILLALLATGCASTPENAEPRAQSRPTTGTETDDSLPAPGYGTLRQDDFTVALRSVGVQIKVTPLAEQVIRLAAPDTYQRLHGMVESRRTRIQQVARENALSSSPRVFLVSFHTFERQAEFTPTDVNILSQGILYRPLGILPLTPGWGQEQIKQEVTQSALYIFHPEIRLDVRFRLEYRGFGTSAWEGIIPILEAERGRVLSRAKSD